MDYKQREEAALRVAASVREALVRIMSDRSAGHQIVRGIDTGEEPGKQVPPKV